MRWNYFIRTFFKSIVLLVTILFIVAVVYDTSSKAKEDATKTSWMPENLRTEKKLEVVNTLINEQYHQKSVTTPKSEKQDNNGPYLTSSEVELDGAKPENYPHILRYNERFWDLAIPTDTNASLTNKNTKPIVLKDLINLWRPVKGQLELDAESSDRIVPQLVWQMEASNSSFSNRIKPKKILIWDTFQWWSKASWKNEDPRQLKQSDCPNTPGSVGQCIFTEDQSKLNNVDAVITAHDSFHQRDIDVPEHVLKFNFILESPFHSHTLLTRANHLLATYWRGSDLVTPYSKWVYYDLNKKLQPQGRDYTIGKSKPVAIFVSNCGAWNDRIGFVEELEKSIEVDVYGHCGSLNCARSKEKTCFEMLQKDYYFYLSFENSNCRDYITEKLFTNGLQNDVIPVVMGAHPDDYKAMAPYKSYIHIEDFDDPKELAEYMKFLIKHPAKYNEYFKWKGTGEFISTDLFCRLCAMVHYADMVPPPKREKAYGWGHGEAVANKMCLGQGIWYWTKKANKPTTGRPKRKQAFMESEEALG